MTTKNKKPASTSSSFPTEDELRPIREKLKKGEKLIAGDFSTVLQLAAAELGEHTSRGSHIFDYLSDVSGLETSSLNSYFFTSYGILEKDIAADSKPYVAFTMAIIHAIALGVLLGKLRYDVKPNSSSDGEAKSKPTRKRSKTKRNK